MAQIGSEKIQISDNFCWREIGKRQIKGIMNKQWVVDPLLQSTTCYTQCLDLFQSLYDFFTEIRNYSIFFLLSLPVHSGSLKRIDYPKQLSGPPSFF